MTKRWLILLVDLFVLALPVGCTTEVERARTQGLGPAVGNASTETDNTSVPAGISATEDDLSQSRKDIVAVVNGETVGLVEYEAYLDLFVLREQRTKDRLRKALLGLVNNRLLAREAENERLDRNAAVQGKIALAVSRVWENKYWNEVVRPAVKVTDEEMLAKSPPFADSVHLFQIIVSTRSEAESLRKKLVGNEDSFENIARDRSGGFSASRGGDSGYVSRTPSSVYDNAALNVIFGLKPGEVSPVVQTPIGYTIFKVGEIKSARQQTMEWLEQYRPRALGDKAKEVWETHLRDLRKKHRITVHDENIQKLVKAMEKKEDLTKHKDTILVTVDGKKWVAQDLIDPSGAGVVHGAGVLETLIDSRVKEYVVNAEMEGRNLKKRFPGLIRKERLLREDMLAREMVKRSVRDIRVTEKDIEQYYRNNTGKFMSPKMLNISVIEVGSREMAEKVYEDLGAGKSFEATATAYSMNRTLRGGNLGWLREDSIAPQFASVRELKVGEFNREPVALTDPKTKVVRYVIMRANDVRAGGVLPLAEANRRSVELAVAAAKREVVLAELLDRVRAENQVSIDPNAERLINRFASKGRRGGDHGKDGN